MAAGAILAGIRVATAISVGLATIAAAIGGGGLGGGGLRCKHETITITQDGFTFRVSTFETVENLLRYFKSHYRDLPRRTPTIGSSVSGSVQLF